MQFLRGLRNTLLPVARAEQLAEAAEQEEAPPAPSMPFEAPQPSIPPPKTLESLSPEEIESLKQEIVDDVVTKIAGEEGEKLEDFLEPEIVTAPYDPRFPNRNQARHCFVRFNEFFKCAHERGEDHPRCVFYQRAYQSLCPADWLENWQELREQGLWTGKY
ncbi:mitochondrial cytochrome c oxidase subunit [Dunaliella salina]|uniref:Mitochondrial cytochrome c oxidase subunit n=1 Tax=Dunaliella salina TaxID=3046 RepID=A0ABQ7FVQ2_DUNSA|nr:mitochondrial cytochrome c oxidase subunit [Dunaliella salina]|eukprot:KAF5826426.1 mitochondrial cytochrome c oxidase subunit [Dunaliella salina]